MKQKHFGNCRSAFVFKEADVSAKIVEVIIPIRWWQRAWG